jgi:hypothetical protein
VGAPGRFARIGGVYAVEPAGLELAEDAYAVVTPPSPDALEAPDGGDLVAVHYVWSPTDGVVRPAPATRTWHLADGRAAVIATLYELGTHWVGDRVPGADRTLPRLSVRVGAESTEAVVGETFAVTELSLASDSEHLLYERAVTGAVVRPAPAGAAPTAAVPIAGPEWATRRGDATVDPERGLHVLAHLAEGAHEERLARFETTEPVTFAADEPLAPLVGSLPAWRCERASEDAGGIWVGVDVVTGASAGVVRVGTVRELGAARCR